MVAGRHLVALVLMVGLIAVPSVAAEPTGREDDPAIGDEAFHGIAYSGTVDTADEWFPDQLLCLTVLTTFQITLVLDEGAATNAVELFAPTTLGLTLQDAATPAKPATLIVRQADSCVDFTVRSALVDGAQPYTVYVTHLPV